MTSSTRSISRVTSVLYSGTHTVNPSASVAVIWQPSPSKMFCTSASAISMPVTAQYRLTQQHIALGKALERYSRGNRKQWFRPAISRISRSRTFGGIFRTVGVGTALKAERRIGFEPVAFARAAYRGRLETGTFKNRFTVASVTPESAPPKIPGKAQRRFGVADHQVVGGEFAFRAVQRNERRTLRTVFYDDFVALDFAGIKRMQGPACFKQHKVGDVHHVVDGAQAHGFQEIFEPLGRLAHLHAGDVNAAVALASLRIFYRKFNGRTVGLGSKFRHGRYFNAKEASPNRKRAMMSRAAPKCEAASGRLGVMLISIVWSTVAESSRPRACPRAARRAIL